MGIDSVWQQIRHCGHWTQKLELICLNTRPVIPSNGGGGLGFVGVADKVQKSQSQVACLKL